MDTLRRLRLFHQLLLLRFGQPSVNLMQGIVVGDGIVSYRQAYLLLSLLSLDFFVVAALLGTRARVSSMMTLISPPVFMVALIVVVSFSLPVLG